MSRFDHANLGRRLVDGVLERFVRCSCGQEYTGQGAARMLDEHLIECPDEADFLTPSASTEEWVEHHYDDRTMTLDEWRARR